MVQWAFWRSFAERRDEAQNNTKGVYQPVPTTTATVNRVSVPRSPLLVADNLVDKGAGLERWVPINTFFSFLATLTFIWFATDSLFDSDVSGITTASWVYLLAGMLGISGLLFLFNVLLSSRKWRKEVYRNGHWYAYPDTWYHTHMSVAATDLLLASWTFFGVYLYYRNFGGEGPYKWPSAYNIEQWRKPVIWFSILSASCIGRITMLTDKYLAVYRALAVPGLIEVDTAAKEAVRMDT